jgi:DNA-binding MarR family transcriptional regulator
VPNDANGLDRSPIHLLHRAGQAADSIFAAEMGDLTPRQLAVLITVSHNEGASQTGLVERTGIDRSTLAELVKRMQKKGLLQRRRTKEDARAYAVKLTDEGRRVLRTAEPLGQRIDKRVLNALPEGRSALFLGALETIVEALQHVAVPKPAPRSQSQRPRRQRRTAVRTHEGPHAGTSGPLPSSAGWPVRL